MKSNAVEDRADGRVHRRDTNVAGERQAGTASRCWPIHRCYHWLWSRHDRLNDSRGTGDELSRLVPVARHHESVLRSHTWRTAQNSAAYLLGHLRPGLSLLDVGCGPGTITVDLAARVAPGRVVGLDAAGPIVEQARGLSDSVEWRVGDAYTLDPDLHDFDVVHAHQVLQHLADPVAEIGRAHV